MKIASCLRKLAVLSSAALLVAAKGGGCSAEHQPGDGSADLWDIGEIPTAIGADQPMTCEWLESNCWTEFAAAVENCAPDTQGTFASDRASCTYDDGSVLQLEGPISEPAPGIVHFPFVNHRLLDENGDACFTSKILGPAHGAFRAGGKTVVVQSQTLTTYRVICQDGSSYSNAVEGSCPELGALWLAHRTPGYVFSCDGTSGVCSSELWGGTPESGAAVTFQTCGEG